MNNSNNKIFSVLLVEDDAINQIIFQEILKDYNLKIDVVCNGLEAITILEKNQYDIIFIDMYMPIMDGIEATKQIRQKNITIPIILLSASADEINRDKLKSIGMNDYLFKPIDIDNLDKLLFIYLSNFNLNQKINRINNLYHDNLEIPDISGIDTLVGLKHMNDDKRLYLKTLLEFSKNYDHDNIKTLGYQDFARKIHTIKGLARSLGAYEISEMAKEIESGVSEGRIEDFLIALRILLKEIRSVVKENNSDEIV